MRNNYCNKPECFHVVKRRFRVDGKQSYTSLLEFRLYDHEESPPYKYSSTEAPVRNLDEVLDSMQSHYYPEHHMFQSYPVMGVAEALLI